MLSDVRVRSEAEVVAILLAGLRSLQCALEEDSLRAGVEAILEDVADLELEEIDQLCEDLNCGEFRVVSLTDRESLVDIDDDVD